MTDDEMTIADHLAAIAAKWPANPPGPKQVAEIVVAELGFDPNSAEARHVYQALSQVYFARPALTLYRGGDQTGGGE